MLDISEFDKDQLAEYAKTVFNVELDLRKSLDKLKAEVVKLQEKPKAEPVSAAIPQGSKATHILNRDTGRWFPYTELLYKHLTNAVPCDENGNPV
jgi:hypothetical protein